MRLLKAYRSNIILLSSVILGGILGAIAGPKAAIVEPFGDLFLNLMFMIIVPLVFFSVTSAIGNMSNMKRLGKILVAVVIVFTGTALLTALISLFVVLFANPAEGINSAALQTLMSKNLQDLKATEKVSFIKQVVNTFTVTDFINIFSRKNMVQLIVFSVGLAIAAAMAKEKAQALTKVLEAGASVMMKFVDIIMYYAPIGLGC